MSELDRKRIQVPDMERPHVVILGAGASLAAFPPGNKYGLKLPLMWNIVDVVGLGEMLDEAGITEHRDDFETLYSNLVIAGEHPELVRKIDSAVFDYFASLELPDEPTLYDHLVRSLRKKDVIATFNWDPFLVQAIARSQDPDLCPVTLFLHGNTAIGHCMDPKPIAVGARGNNCHRCNKPLQDSRLLYPVGQKNYASDPYIAKSWELLQRFLQDAFVVTVFGYSAPVTDVEAVDLLKAGWENAETRNLEEIEILDIREEEELYNTWEPFIHSHHCRFPTSFYNSIIGLSPRRSCEAMWATLMDVVFIEPNPIPQDAGWDELDDYFNILHEDEQNFNTQTENDF